MSATEEIGTLVEREFTVSAFEVKAQIKEFLWSQYDGKEDVKTFFYREISTIWSKI